MSGADPVLLDERNGNHWLTLNRPEALNAINEPMMEGLLRCLDQIGDSGRPLILTGAGRAFCAGGDLRGYLAKLDDPQAMRRYFDIVTRLFNRLADYQGATIAADDASTLSGRRCGERAPDGCPGSGRAGGYTDIQTMLRVMP